MRSTGGSHRPYDWAPLAERDPVPGDPAGIRDEAAHMRRTAQALRDQARELRAIAETDELKGAYADTLRSGAADLEHHLRQTAERYERVQSHLSSWAGELEDLQSESVAVLRRAQEESASAPSNGKPPADNPAHPPVPPHDDPVQPMRRSLERLTIDRDDRAAVYSARIRRACDDVIADSVWERVEDDVGAVLNNSWIQKAFETAGWIVSVISIVALFLTPAGWIVDIVLALTVTLVTKDVLALIVGNGSWFDVAMDAIGLLTAGTGKLAFTALARIQSATRLAAQSAAEERATAAVLDEARPLLDRTYRATGRRGVGRAAKNAARQLRTRIIASADHAGTQARHAVSTRPLTEATPLQKFAFGGDADAANHAADIDAMRAEYGDDEGVRRASGDAGKWKKVFNSSWRVGVFSDVVDKGMGHSDLLAMKPSLPEYDRLKDRCAATIGTGW